MNQLWSFFGLVAFVFIANQPARAHPGGEARVEIELESSDTVSAGSTVVEFRLVDTQQNKVLTSNDLAITHEKKLHFLIYDPGLKEFQHVHPEFDGTLWKADLNFQVNGDYFVWAQGEIETDAVEFSALTRVKIVNGKPSWPAPSLGDIRSGSDQGSIASLSPGPLRAGQMAMLILKLSRADGTAAQITPYLGAFAHVIATPEDGNSLLHVHPMNGSTSNQGMLHVTFQEAGSYRLWIQFLDAGVLKTVRLSVVVTN